MRRTWGALAGLILTGVAGVAQAQPFRIMALDQCADQYVLALSPDSQLALSPRADDPDAADRAGQRGVGISSTRT